MVTIVAVAFRHHLYGVASLPAPARHHNLLPHARDLGWPNYARQLADQGFMTSDGHFVDRYAAMPIAVAAGQFNRRAPAHPEQLFSEDLW